MTVRGYQLAVDWDGDGGLTRLSYWDRWFGGGTVNPTVGVSTVRSHSGVDSLLITWGTAGTLPSADIIYTGLTAGVIYTLRGWVYVPTGSLSVVWAVSGIGFGPPGTPVNNAWYQIDLTFTATSATHQLQIWPTSSPAGGEQVWLDDPTIQTAHEDVTSYLLDDPRLQVGYGRDKARGLSPMAAGKLSFALDNRDRRFSPENTASPIVDDIVPGRPVVLQHTDSTSAVTLFDGVLDDFDIASNTPEKAFTGQCLDAWGRPGAERLSTALYQGLRTGEAVHVILDQIGWPTATRDVDPGATIMPWWWVEGDDAATAIQTLVDSEGPPAVAYVEGGLFVYRDRHHRLLRAASQTVQATFRFSIPTYTAPGGSLAVLKGPQYDRGLRNIVNSVGFNVDQRQPAGTVVVWSSDQNFQLSSGEIDVVEVQTSDPFFDAVVPVAGVDYTLVSGTVEVWLSHDSGQSIAIYLHAVGGAAQISGLALRAVPVLVRHTKKATWEDPTSIAKHGRRGYPPSSGLAGIYDARAIAEHVVGVYSRPRPSVTVSIANLDNTYMTHIRARRISDRIRYKNDDLGLDAEFYIERVDHDIKKLGAIHTASFGCEMVELPQPANVFQFDTVGVGFDDGVFGYSGTDDPNAVWIWDHPTQGKFDIGQFAI